MADRSGARICGVYGYDQEAVRAAFIMRFAAVVYGNDVMPYMEDYYEP